MRVAWVALACAFALAGNAHAQSIECAEIRWQESTGPVVGYDVYVEVDGASMLYHASTPDPRLVVEGTGFAVGDALRFQVVPYAEDGLRGEPSEISDVIFCQAVPTPDPVTATDGSLSQPIELSWAPISGVESYVIFRSLTPSGPGIFIDQIDGAVWRDEAAQIGVDYFYSVASLAGRQVSEFSIPVAATAFGTVPRAVPQVSSIVVDVEPTQDVVTRSFELENVGDWAVDYQAWPTSSWLRIVGAASGTLVSGSTTMTLELAVADLPEGEHTATIRIYSYYEPAPGEAFEVGAPETLTVVVDAPQRNASPEVFVPAEIRLREGQTTTVPISATDPDEGDHVYMDVYGVLPSWVVFEPLGSGEGRLVLSPDYESAGTYDAVAGAWDDHLPAASGVKEFTIVIEDVNRSPTPAVVPDQELRAGETLTLPVSAIDPDLGDQIAIVASSLPGFARIDDFGGGVGEIELEPLASDVGEYLFIVSFVDNGSPSRSASVWFRVQVDP